MPEVRLIGEDGNQIGVIKTSEALSYAQQRDLDLVEVAPEARPPVVRVLDYSKYKYEQAQKQKAARKHQQQITIREIKFRPKIAQNDYDTKKSHVTRFLLGKDKVKITIMFRGREVTHPERGTALLNRLSEELSEIAVVEQMPLQDGRNMTMMLGPSKSVLAGEKDKTAEGEENGATAAEPAPAAQEKPSTPDEPAAEAPAAEPAKPAAAEPAKPAAAEPAEPAAAEPAAAAEPSAATEPPAAPAAQPAPPEKQTAGASSDASG
ncbi:MAG: translation initiation factor [Solirubrobacteraceae bacterium]|nr:translation initiation factor [Solirubrobacteraceae bacterium]